MITWIVYIIVALILCFILYIAFQGISRGIEAKNYTKKDFMKKKVKIKLFQMK